MSLPDRYERYSTVLGVSYPVGHEDLGPLLVCGHLGPLLLLHLTNRPLELLCGNGPDHPECPRSNADRPQHHSLYPDSLSEVADSPPAHCPETPSARSDRPRPSRCSAADTPCASCSCRAPPLWVKTSVASMSSVARLCRAPLEEVHHLCVDPPRPPNASCSGYERGVHA